MAPNSEAQDGIDGDDSADPMLGSREGVRFGIKSLPIFLDYRVSLLFKNADRALRKQISAYKNFQKMVEGFNGLRGDYIARHEVRRSF